MMNCQMFNECLSSNGIIELYCGLKYGRSGVYKTRSMTLCHLCIINIVLPIQAHYSNYTAGLNLCTAI